MLLTDRLSEAFSMSLRLHRDQVRNETEIPYISHPMAVCAFVLEHGGDEDTAIAALLHDAAEDQGGKDTLDEIERRFGSRVSAIVRSCSDSLPAMGEQRRPWLERKLAYLAHLRSVDRPTALVSLADKIHNAGAILRDLRRDGLQTLSHFTPTSEQILWYYGSVAAALAERHRDLPVAELETLVAALQEEINQVRTCLAPAASIFLKLWNHRMPFAALPPWRRRPGSPRSARSCRRDPRASPRGSWRRRWGSHRRRSPSISPPSPMPGSSPPRATGGRSSTPPTSRR